MMNRVKFVAIWTIVTLVLLWCLSFHTQWQTKNAIKKVEGRCLKNQETIFVAIVCRGSHTANLLFNLFENASCPKRISVSVYEIKDGTENSIEDYKNKSFTSSTGMSYEKKIHIMRREQDDAGLYGALKELMTHGYKSERFICTLSECFVADQFWDQKLIDLQKPTTCLVMGSGYPFISGFQQDFPVFDHKESTKTPSRFWTLNASFALSDFWFTLSDEYKFAGNASEFIITCEAISNGWSFLHIPMQFEKSLSLPWADNKLNSKAFRSKYEKKIPNFFPLSKNSLLGVVNDNDDAEINTKFGSRSEYVYAINKMLN